MTDKSPWWRSFVGKRRSAARESAREAMLAQQQAQAPQPQTSTQTQSVESPQPSAELTHTTTADHTPAAATEPQRPCSEKRNNSAADLEPTFNESTNRRNLRVSRSGRFKERKRVRVSLLQDEEEHTDKSSDKEDASAQGQ
ncbi:proline-rich protein 15 [Alosa alosa]|uniref:proline-rich protein 15 n=1 Tax=Alosa sapidissima TaxID=34773 RepID=UPI001C09B28B|nr:proline-rich protein 15 [Alosa sapidissima]XP_041932523.1 proline-rich protein 15 [Alosa sapidissima]XP_048085902.1 proline-rich protein 15 [Alosa alosa]XP_048085903.1 proline-rich protein 15 [Alosa alosa]XP_048085904.1 proline-rich protein 15 [Alosa alosa]